MAIFLCNNDIFIVLTGSFFTTLAMVILSVSILDLDFLQLDNRLRELRTAGVEHVHIDIVDTSFAPNISFGPSILNGILEYDFHFDLHFMIGDPLIILRQLCLERVWLIMVHSHVEETREFVRGSDIMVGVALNPDEGIETTAERNILVMAVQPGFGGQKFSSESLRKIEEGKRAGKWVGVDGGVNESNIKSVRDADMIVIGSVLTKSDRIGEKYNGLLRMMGNHSENE